jgi:hypothetical protein
VKGINIARMVRLIKSGVVNYMVCGENVNKGKHTKNIKIGAGAGAGRTWGRASR